MSTFRNNIFIAITGPVASGKTTLGKVIAEQFSFSLISENLNSHPYLSLFYEDMNKWGFHTATWFLTNAISTQHHIQNTLNHRSVCQDWYCKEHHNVYNSQMYETGILSKEEYKICSIINETLDSILINPDLLIYLTANSHTLQSRIFDRSRPAEIINPPTIEYIETLRLKYEEWTNTLNSPMLKIDTHELDLFSKKVQKKVTSRIIEVINLKTH